jgi:hypothetical protein
MKAQSLGIPAEPEKDLQSGSGHERVAVGKRRDRIGIPGIKWNAAYLKKIRMPGMMIRSTSSHSVYHREI